MKIGIIYLVNHVDHNFLKTIELLKKEFIFKIDLIDFETIKNIELNDYYIILIKCNLNSKLYYYCKQYFKNHKKKCYIGIFMSSNKIPSDSEIYFFDILFYKTHWYKNYANLKRHSNIYHAIGIDTDLMKNLNKKKIYDYICVGDIISINRPLKLLNECNNKKIIIGCSVDETISKKLKRNNVKIINYVKYDELVYFYNISKICYLPFKINSGGEKCILEARSCGLNIKIEPDNEKLLELINSEIYDLKYYMNQIKKGLMSLINNDINCVNDIYELYYNFSLSVIIIGNIDKNSYCFIKNNKNIKAFIFEPIVKHFNSLIKKYQNANSHIILINSIIWNENSYINYYTINQIKKYPHFLENISTINIDRGILSKNYWKFNKELYDQFIDTNIKEVKVKSITVEKFINKYKITKIDILIIDFQGYEHYIIKYFLIFIKPKYIIFKYEYIPINEFDKCKQLLLINNYKFIVSDKNIIAIYLYS